MRLASQGGVKWRERESFRLFRLRKRIHQYWRFRPGCPKTIVFIVGCQRSGTSLLSHLFRLDWNVVTYDEMSPLSSGDPEGFRWNPLPEVTKRLLADRAPLVVCKPLVESQRVRELLDAFPGSRAIWMFRDFRGVARSNLAFFGGANGIRDMAPILAGDRRDWRSEGLTDSDTALAAELMATGTSELDAAALFWYFRNILAPRNRLETDERVVFCDYDRLAADPIGVLEGAYRHLGHRFPGRHVTHDVASSSPGRDGNEGFTPAVTALCDDLLSDLRSYRNL